LSLAFQEKVREKKKDQLPKVDYHCHISMTEYADPDHPTRLSVSKEEFLADLQEAGIDKAVVLAGTGTSPEEVSRFVRQAPDRFIGFGYVNPLDHDAPEDVIRQSKDLGLFGLKLYPTTDGYRADDSKAFRVYEVAVDLRMPVMFHHAGMPSPSDLLRVACSFPRLRIVLAHLGYPRVDETLYVARKHRNVWCDISWPYGDVNHPSYPYMLCRDLLTALNLGVIGKLVFGTDYPGVRQRPYIETLMSVNRYAPHPDLEIPEDSLMAMLDENVRPLLP